MERPSNLHNDFNTLYIKDSDDLAFPFIVDYDIPGVSSGIAFFHDLESAVRYFESVRDTLWFMYVEELESK